MNVCATPVSGGKSQFSVATPPQHASLINDLYNLTVHVVWHSCGRQCTQDGPMRARTCSAAHNQQCTHMQQHPLDGSPVHNTHTTLIGGTLTYCLLHLPSCRSRPGPWPSPAACVPGPLCAVQLAGRWPPSGLVAGPHVAQNYLRHVARCTADMIAHMI